MSESLESDRLLRRLPEAGDLDAIVALWADPAVTAFIVGPPRVTQGAIRLVRAPRRLTRQGHGTKERLRHV